MSALTEALGNSSNPLTINWEGKDHPLRCFDQSMKADLEKYLYERAVEGLNREIEIRKLPPTEIDRKFDLLADRYVNGYYSFASDFNLAFIQSKPGMIKVASMIFGLDDISMMKLFKDKQQEVISKIRLVLSDSFVLSGKGGVPNVPPAS